MHLIIHDTISVLRLEKADFRRLVLPQMVLFNIVTGLIEGFMKSMRPKGSRAAEGGSLAPKRTARPRMSKIPSKKWKVNSAIS